MLKCNRKYIDDYLHHLETTPQSKENKKLVGYVRERLTGAVYDLEKTEKAKELIERYFFKLLPWELFVLACVHCYDQFDNSLIFDTFLIIVGTGNGKNGFISGLSWYLTTHYHGIKKYNIELIANSEEQAKTSFDDVWDVLDDTWEKSKNFFYKTKEVIRNLFTGSEIKYNTTNARTRTGKRAGCLVFDEILDYTNWVVYNAFNASFGKIEHGRKFLIGTNGYVRGGFLDDWLELAKGCLDGEIKSMRLLPMIFKLDKKEEVHNKKLWSKANPSIDYFPQLKRELETQYETMSHQPQLALDFLTKRMNLPAQDTATPAVTWDKIEATNREMPDLTGLQCIGAFDYASVHDFASCGLLFKHGGMRYWIEHSFVCHKALDIDKPINFPVMEMAERGLITIVREDSIRPAYLVDWFLEMAKKYHILKIAGDTYRITLVEGEFIKHGIPLTKVRSGPITHSLVAPLVQSIFSEEKIIFGDNPVMRWYTNNTGSEQDKKGNITYYKIEPIKRKTDGFSALIHALTLDKDLLDHSDNVIDLGVHTY